MTEQESKESDTHPDIKAALATAAESAAQTISYPDRGGNERFSPEPEEARLWESVPTRSVERPAPVADGQPPTNTDEIEDSGGIMQATAAALKAHESDDGVVEVPIECAETKPIAAALSNMSPSEIGKLVDAGAVTPQSAHEAIAIRGKRKR